MIYHGHSGVVEDIALGIMAACSILHRLKSIGSTSGDRTSLRNRGGGLSESTLLVGSRTMHRRLPPCIAGHWRLRCSTAFRVGRISSRMRFARSGIVYLVHSVRRTLSTS